MIGKTLRPGTVMVSTNGRIRKRLRIDFSRILRKKSLQLGNTNRLLFLTIETHPRARRIILLSCATIVVAVIIFGLPGLVVEHAYAQQESSSIVKDTTALVAAFGALLGSIGGVIIAIVGFLSNRKKSNGNTRELAETYDDLKKVGLSLQKTDRWVLENEEKIAALVSAVSEFDPKIKDSAE